uniref:MS118, putative transposase n=1 Tax=Microscilla sp. PRE1 TaxID=155537 RepID=Q93PB3_9BACT|nr:IS200/IS605 family transposase [Microscilla sp. PRE1]AAK62840.1 MS118, putative transposase [Microscilla sp. PRE1]
MQNYRKGSHTLFDLKYHLVWITKYRKQVLVGSVAERSRELIREICKANDVEIVKGHVSKDHIHLFVSVPPKLSVSKLMQYLKGKTSHKMLFEFKHLQRQFWGKHIWTRGYFAVSNVTDEVIMQYIENQDVEQKDDNFEIGS